MKLVRLHAIFWSFDCRLPIDDFVNTNGSVFALLDFFEGRGKLAEVEAGD